MVTWKRIGVNCVLVDQQPWHFATVVLMVDCCGCNVVSDVLLASLRVVEQAMVNVSMQGLST